MGRYDKLKQNTDAQKKLEHQLDIASQGFTEMSEDAHRTSEIYNNADTVLSDIDERFMQITKFDKTDVVFLMLATALQIGRWVLFAELSKAIDKKINQARVEHNDKSIVEMEKEKRKQYMEKHIDDEHVKSKNHRDWANIVFDSVPYDISRGCKSYGINMEGGYHRIHTLGHDPILGWLFGTINILSDTITLDKENNFRTFNVEMMKSPKQWTTESTIANAFQKAYVSVQEDISRLPAAVFAQALHLKSDEFTKLGLPIPFLETFSPDMAGKLYREGYDSLKLLKDLSIFSGQAIASVIINMLITLIHGLFYDETKYKSRELYEAKTRKILLYSNLIATSSNIVTVAGMTAASIHTGNPVNVKKVLSNADVGGIIVTMYRLTTDVKFIRKVKNEFIEKEWYNAVVGEEYKFIAEAKEMGKKDILKGIEIQAKADAAKAEKIAEGLSVQADILNNIKNTQKAVHQKVDVVIQDKCDQEAALKYGLKTNKKLMDLDYTEKRVLSAAIYTLMAQNAYISDLQREFFECIEAYGAGERSDDFDFKYLRNIDSYSDRRIILKVICIFLFLQELKFDFVCKEKYKWLSEFTSQQDIGEICDEIEREYHILGKDIISGYRPPIVASLDKEVAENSSIEENNKTEKDIATDFSQIKELISKSTENEKAFGKRISIINQAFVNKELSKDYPKVSTQAVIKAMRIANGCLIFTAFAMYAKTGNIINGRYVRLPYKNIIANKIYTEEGRFKGTRKLVIPYVNENKEVCNIELDDIKLEEEQLRDLIIEITSLDCEFPVTDEYIEFIDLDSEKILCFFGILYSLLKKNEHTLTEMFLLLKDFDLQSHWNDFITDDDAENLEDLVDRFVNSLPYPSEQHIKEEATRMLMQTVCRSNLLEGKETTVLTKDEEMIIKSFCCDNQFSDADFNILFKKCSKNIRVLGLDTLNMIIDDIENEDVLVKDCIIADLNKIIDTLNEQELAKQKKTAAKLKRTLQDKAIPIAKVALEKTEKQIAQKLREKELNAYPICTETMDDYLANDYTSEAVKELNHLGIDAGIYVAQGSMFGYVLCKDTEIDEIIEKFSSNKHCVISKNPVDKSFKKMILGKAVL